MTRHEFLNKLKSSLENDLSGNSVQEHITYYNDYINNEIRTGRNEADIIAELGDPWAIAKSIIASEDASSSNYDEYSYASTEEEISRRNRYDDAYRRTSSGPKVHVFGLDKWWKKLLLILGIIGVVMIVFSIITGLISLIAPFIIPILIVSFILKLIKKR